MPSPRDSPPSLTASSTRSSACEKKPARQRPGAACLECRSKKLKCDGKPPQCGTCIASGTKCTPPTTQIQRGPKRGHLKILQNKISISRSLAVHISVNQSRVLEDNILNCRHTGATACRIAEQSRSRLGIYGSPFGRAFR